MVILNFDPYPLLETERLVLRRPAATDDAATFEIRADKDHNKYVDRPIATSIEDAQQFLQKLNDGIDKNEWISWVINRKGDDTLLGSVGLWNISKESGVAEIGFELHKRYQGQGIMREAVKAALEYGFNEMQLTALEGWVHKDNERSIKLMEKFGFKRDPHAEAPHKGKDHFNDMNIYTLFNK